MKKLFLFLILFSPLASAETNQSIMFTEQETAINQKPVTLSTSKHGKHCDKLRQERLALKGKPQRRWAISERIKIECENANHQESDLPFTNNP